MNLHELPNLPRNPGETLSFKGRGSGKDVTFTRLSETEIEWYYDHLPNDVRTLTQDKDSFWVGPSNIGLSVSGGWSDWEFVVDNL